MSGWKRAGCVLLGLLAVFMVASRALARTIIVAADGSGEYTWISDGVGVAEPGDTVLVRPGDYWDERFIVDSAVVVMAEQPGQAVIWSDPTVRTVTLFSGAELRGFVIVGSFMGINQIMVAIFGDAAVIENCYFDAYARYGWQLLVESHNVAPTIVHCRFDLEYGNPNSILWHRTPLDMWMPFNCYGDGITDTAVIHVRIQDRAHGDTTVGYVYVTPVWEEFQWLAADERRPEIPQKLGVRVFPNPFNSTAQIEFMLPVTLRVSLRLYDVLGREVAVLVEGMQSAGAHRVSFDGRGLCSGVYFARLDAGSIMRTQKVVVLR